MCPLLGLAIYLPLFNDEAYGPKPGAALGAEAIMAFWVKQLSLEKSAETELSNLTLPKEIRGMKLLASPWFCRG